MASENPKRRWWQRRRTDYLAVLGFAATTAFFTAWFIDDKPPDWKLLLAALWLAVGAPAADRLAEAFARWLAERYGPRP